MNDAGRRLSNDLILKKDGDEHKMKEENSRLVDKKISMKSESMKR
jgi:hypothetical protein